MDAMDWGEASDFVTIGAVGKQEVGRTGPTQPNIVLKAAVFTR